jgi:hypothetical protein
MSLIVRTFSSDLVLYEGLVRNVRAALWQSPAVTDGQELLRRHGRQQTEDDQPACQNTRYLATLSG